MDHSLSEGEIPRSHRSFWGGYATMSGFCLPLVIAFAVSCVSNYWQRVMLFVLVALAVVLTALYGSRSPLLVVAISVIVFFALFRAWKALAIAFLVMAIGAGWFATQSNIGYLEKYRSLAQAGTYVTNQGLSKRLDVWSGVAEVIEARPLLGYGYGWKKLAWAINEGGYAERWKANDPGKAAYFLGEETHASYGKVNPHNYFLQVAFEIGIPGLLMVLAFWLAVFWQGLQGLVRGPVEHQRLRVVILTTLLAYLLSNLANGFWVGGWPTGLRLGRHPGRTDAERTIHRCCRGEQMNILVIRRDNIGDLVCTTPMLAALRKAMPMPGSVFWSISTTSP